MTIVKNIYIYSASIPCANHMGTPWHAPPPAWTIPRGVTDFGGIFAGGSQ